MREWKKSSIFHVDHLFHFTTVLPYVVQKIVTNLSNRMFIRTHRHTVKSLKMLEHDAFLVKSTA